MKRLGRWLFNLAAVVSLLLFLLMAGLWLRNWVVPFSMNVIWSRGSDASVVDRISLLDGGRIGLQHSVAVARLSGRRNIKADSLHTVWSWDRLGVYCARLEFRSGAPPTELVQSSFHYVIVQCGWGAAYAGVLPAWWLRRFIRGRNQRREPGQCPTCGYDLRATPDRCPECGAIPATAERAMP